MGDRVDAAGRGDGPGHARDQLRIEDHRPEAGRDYAQRLGIAADRAYGDWKEMLEGERTRDDRIDLVTVATPNSTHFEITKAFLEDFNFSFSVIFFMAEL